MDLAVLLLKLSLSREELVLNLTFINVSVGLDPSAKALRLVPLEITLVDGAVGLHAHSITFARLSVGVNQAPKVLVILLFKDSALQNVILCLVSLVKGAQFLIDSKNLLGRKLKIGRRHLSCLQFTVRLRFQWVRSGVRLCVRSRRTDPDCRHHAASSGSKHDRHAPVVAHDQARGEVHRTFLLASVHDHGNVVLRQVDYLLDDRRWGNLGGILGRLLYARWLLVQLESGSPHLVPVRGRWLCLFLILGRVCNGLLSGFDLSH
jgi:hypothetical protein